MLVSCNGVPVLSGEIVMPRIGAWTGELALDGDPPTGRCTISVGDGAVTFVGTALPSDKIVGRTAVKVVGGAGGLTKVLPHRQHRGVPLSIPLGAILAEAGETLSGASDAAALATALPSWSRRAGGAGEAIAELVGEAGAAWRVLADGTVWVGRETWPELTAMVQLLRPDPANDTAEVATDLPILRPGVVVGGRRISAVTHRFEPSRVRTFVHYERGDHLLDRMKSALVGIARAALSDVDYHASYAATVVRHLDSGLEVRVDDERFASLAGTGTSGVKHWPGVPGVSYVLRRGARVLVGFLDGRPKVPIATGWNSGTPERLTFEADRIELGAAATKGIVRKDDEVDCGTLDFLSPSVGSVTVTYTPAAGGAPTVVALAGTGLTVAPTTIAIRGKAVGASSKSFAE